MLVVDDNPDSAQTLAEVIRMMGHEAQFHTSPALVEPALELFKPHVLLLDIGMPEVDGWTLARSLRPRYNREQLKIVAVTGYAAASDHVRSREAGFDAHVAKPIDFEMLARVLEQCFSQPVRLPTKVR